MFAKIERNDKIFQSELFLKDAMAFCVMESIRNDTDKYPTPKIFSNHKDCIIVNSDPKHSVIVWTTDNFEEKDKLYDFINNEFHSNVIFKIMSKKNFYNYLVENHKIPNLHVQTLGVYSCPKLNNLQYIGHPDHTKPEEVEQVAQMLVNFNIETGENPEAKISDYIEQAQEFVSHPMCYIWRNEDEKIVAIANVRINEAYPRIGRVYTKSEERGKSYAKMLVHYLTSLALKKGKTPMLFTDFDYLPSNRCYQAIGYELKCTIVNFMPTQKNRTQTGKIG